MGFRRRRIRVWPGKCQSDGVESAFRRQNGHPTRSDRGLAGRMAFRRAGEARFSGRMPVRRGRKGLPPAQGWSGTAGKAVPSGGCRFDGGKATSDRRKGTLPGAKVRSFQRSCFRRRGNRVQPAGSGFGAAGLAVQGFRSIGDLISDAGRHPERCVGRNRFLHQSVGILFHLGKAFLCAAVELELHAHLLVRNIVQTERVLLSVR